MSKKLQNAMPVGSTWNAHHSFVGGMGFRTVKGYKTKEMVLVNHAKGDTNTFLSWPKADLIDVSDPNVIKIMDESDPTKVLLTYTRVEGK